MEENNCGQIWGTIPVMSSWNWEKNTKTFRQDSQSVFWKRDLLHKKKREATGSRHSVQEIGIERNNSVTFAVFDTNKHVKQLSGCFSAQTTAEDSSSFAFFWCLQTRIQYEGHQAPFTKNTGSDCLQGSSSAHLPADFTSETRKRILVTFGTCTTVKISVRYRLIHFSNGKSLSINFLYNGSSYKHELRIFITPICSICQEDI